MTHATKHPRRMALPIAAVAALLLAGCSSGNVGESWQCPLADAGTCDSVAAADPAVPDMRRAPKRGSHGAALAGAEYPAAERLRSRRPAMPPAMAGSIPSPGWRGCSGSRRTTRGRPIGRRNRSPRNPSTAAAPAAVSPADSLPAEPLPAEPGSAALPGEPAPAPLPAEPESPELLAGGETSPGDHDDLRTDEVVARIWIAPFVDADGVYREASWVRAVLEPAGWRLGR